MKNMKSQQRLKRITLAVSALLYAGSILADASIYQVNIPSQRLDLALQSLAKQSGAQILFVTDSVAVQQSKKLQASLTVEQALNELLDGTNLKVKSIGVNKYSLIEGKEQARDMGQLNTIDVLGQEGQAIVQLPVIKITADENTYIANRPSYVATKSTLAPRQTPFTINQVSQELIQERGDQSIFETLENFAGLTTASNNGDIGQGMSRSLSVRGFSVGQTLVNGQRTYSSSAGNAQSTDSLESVEVLRGPAGLYYGSAEPGGVINLQYKRPKANAAYEIVARTDSKGSYGGMFDATGSINQDQTVRYRTVLSYQHRIDDQDHIWSEPKSGMFALSYVPSDAFETSLTYELSQMNSVPEQINNSKDATTGNFYEIPRDFFWGSLDDEAERKTNNVLWDMKWEISPLLKLNANFNYQQYEQFWQNTRFSGGTSVIGDVERYVSGRQSEGKSHSGNIDLSGKFDFWNLGHEWLIGGGFGHEEGSSSGRAVASETRKDQPYEVGSINIYNPVYKNWGHRDRIYTDPLVSGSKRDDQNIYLQNIVTLPNQKTRLMLGAGWTEYKTTPALVNTGNPIRIESEWTPRIAIMHDILPTATVYASYGENFTPNSLDSYDMSGNEITDPLYGTQYELGYKQEFLDSRALASIAVYRLDKENLIQMVQEPLISCNADLNTLPGTIGGYHPELSDCRYQLTGLERSQGVELSLSGQIADWWLADISYAYIDAKYEKTDSLVNLGRTKSNTPKQNFVLWNKFKLHESAEYGRLNGGVGLKAWSEAHSSWSQNKETGEITSNINPGYALVDLSLSWDKALSNDKNLNVGFTVKNLFDKTYYDRNRFANNGNIVWGDERRALLTAKLKF